MIVMKFGGTSVGNAARVRNLLKIVNQELHNKPVVVVSALGGVTDRILKVANDAAAGKNTKPH